MIQVRLFLFRQGTALDPVPSDAMCAVARRLGRSTYEHVFENIPIEAEASAYTTLRENGTGCRAGALLRRCATCSKVRSIF
jgi:hypothetical protein